MTNDDQYSLPGAQSQSTLHPKSMDHDHIEINKVIEHLSNLNAEQKRRFVDYLQRVLVDSAVWKKGAGVTGQAKHPNRNEEFLDADRDFDLVQFDEALSENLEAAGMSRATQQRASELFFAAVEERLFHEDSEFQNRLFELVAESVPSPFISDEELDVTEILANRIEELEEAICEVENENERLFQEIQAEELIDEDYSRVTADHDRVLKLRSPKRSSLDEMLEANPENEDAYFNESRTDQQHVGIEPEMKLYLDSYRVPEKE